MVFSTSLRVVAIVVSVVSMVVVLSNHSLKFLSSLLSRNSYSLPAQLLSEESIVTSERQNYQTTHRIIPSIKKTWLDPLGPKPVIFISRGRSGSSAIWETIGNLTGYVTRSHELTGSDPDESRKFFRSVDNNGDWMLQDLSRKQLLYPNAGIVGFQWKPFDMCTETALAALRIVASSERPKISVILSRRNPLDILISQAKHTSKLPAHCRKGDAKCSDKHQMKIAFPVENLLGKLRLLKEGDDKVVDLLEDFGVSFVQVTYEKLFTPEVKGDISEWKRILSFLGMELPESKFATIQTATSIAPTHMLNESRSDRLTNFDEVYDVLKGTEFEKMLFS